MIIFYLIGFFLVWWMDRKAEKAKNWRDIFKRLFFSSLSWISFIGLIIYIMYPKPPKWL